MKDEMIGNPRVIKEVKRVEALLSSRAVEMESSALNTVTQPKAQLKWLHAGAHKRAIPVVVEVGRDGYTATTPVLNGCIAEGDTVQEALLDFKKALRSLLKAYTSDSMQVPWECHGLTELMLPGIRIFTVLI